MNTDEIVRVLRDYARAYNAGTPYDFSPGIAIQAGNEINHLKAEIFGQADLIESLQARLVEYDALAAEYGIDGKTMLTLAKSQIKTAQDNIKLRDQLSKEEAHRRVQAERIEEERGRRYECIEAIGNLRTQLAASQRRADAAVEDLRKVLAEGGYGCDFCNHENNQAVCAETCSSESKLGSWQWRGPQDEKGEAE